MTTTHTYAILHISWDAYQEIKRKLAEAGYEDQFHGDLIDMHGIAIQVQPHRCGTCNAMCARCEDCGTEWCLDHQQNPLVCPGCKRRL